LEAPDEELHVFGLGRSGRRVLLRGRLELGETSSREELTQLLLGN